MFWVAVILLLHTFTEDINDFLLSTPLNRVHLTLSWCTFTCIYIWPLLWVSALHWWETSGSSIFCHVFQVSWRVSLRSRSCAPSCVCVWAFSLSIICSVCVGSVRAAPLCWSCFCAEPCSPCRTYTSTYFRWDQMQKDSKLHFDLWLWYIFFGGAPIFWFACFLQLFEIHQSINYLLQKYKNYRFFFFCVL